MQRPRKGLYLHSDFSVFLFTFFCLVHKREGVRLSGHDLTRVSLPHSFSNQGQIMLAASLVPLVDLIDRYSFKRQQVNIQYTIINFLHGVFEIKYKKCPVLMIFYGKNERIISFNLFQNTYMYRILFVRQNQSI